MNKMTKSAFVSNKGFNNTGKLLNLSSIRMSCRDESKGDNLRLSNMHSTTNKSDYCIKNLRNSTINESYPKILPQWIKYNKNVLKFTTYFNEHIVESNVETYRIRACDIFLYLEDETIKVVECKTENSGINQGVIVKRQKIRKDNKFKNINELQDEKCMQYLSYKDFGIGKEVDIFGKRFRICDCDEFTKRFYKEQGIDQNNSEKVPDYVNPTDVMLKKIDNSENLKNITDFKEFCEISLGGGHPNSDLKNFLDNDRKVLKFDLLWDDFDQDKEVKQFKMFYYLAENMVEVAEVRASNSGRHNFSFFLNKSFLPKKPNFTFCPGMNSKEMDIYKPQDLILGNYVNIYNRPMFITDCDDFTKQWYKEK
jgi:hypothetical protein